MLVLGLGLGLVLVLGLVVSERVWPGHGRIERRHGERQVEAWVRLRFSVSVSVRVRASVC